MYKNELKIVIIKLKRFKIFKTSLVVDKKIYPETSCM